MVRKGKDMGGDLLCLCGLFQSDFLTCVFPAHWSALPGTTQVNQLTRSIHLLLMIDLHISHYHVNEVSDLLLIGLENLCPHSLQFKCPYISCLSLLISSSYFELGCGRTSLQKLPGLDDRIHI
jgi:hypothetical protein